MKMTVKCSECGRELDESQNPDTRGACPYCGSFKRHVIVAIEEAITIRDQIRLKVKDPKKTGKAKTRLETKSGYDLHQKSGKWYKLERTLDRGTNRYTEIVTDPETGRIIHRCAEPLNQHLGHGSDRRGSPDP